MPHGQSFYVLFLVKSNIQSVLYVELPSQSLPCENIEGFRESALFLKICTFSQFVAKRRLPDSNKPFKNLAMQSTDSSLLLTRNKTLKCCSWDTTTFTDAFVFDVPKWSHFVFRKKCRFQKKCRFEKVQISREKVQIMLRSEPHIFMDGIAARMTMLESEPKYLTSKQYHSALTFPDVQTCLSWEPGSLTMKKVQISKKVQIFKKSADFQKSADFENVPTWRLASFKQHD